ncbi:MAG: hypothetical protein K6G22_14425 [Lachnospiraceae bacterium]|nr:hypothetical protein [Lachnospiraceae bacterium]
MDKYEYQICADRIKALIAERRFVEAMDIADTIDWRRVKSVSMLGTVSEIYKINKRYEESRDILLLAYERYPGSRTIVYALCELAVKMDDIVQAISFYKEFVKVAPGDTGSYILLYKIYTAQEVSLEERIEVLEEYKKRDYREKWAYELAYLYHMTGQETKCVEECDELILWFGKGKYVTKAMELKKQHADLTPTQELKYNAISAPNLNLVPEYEQPYTAGEPEPEPDPYADQVNRPHGSDIRVSEPDKGQGGSTDKFNTKNLQSELQESVEAYLSGEAVPEADDHILTPNLTPGIAPYAPAEDRTADTGIRVEAVEDVNVAKTQEFNLDDSFDLEKLKNKTAGDILRPEDMLVPKASEITEPESSEPSGSDEISEPYGYPDQTQTVMPSDQADNTEPSGSSETPLQDEQTVQAETADSSVQDEMTKPQDEESSDNDTDKTSSEDKTPDDANKGKDPDTDTDKDEPYTGIYTENNLAQHSQDVRNRNRYMPKRYEELLGEEYDGQITISSSIDGDMVEKQITGQMDIDEFLRNWEEKKIRKKNKNRDNDLSRTDDLYDKLKGVIPTNMGGSVKSLEESRPIIHMVNVPETMIAEEPEEDNSDKDDLHNEDVQSADETADSEVTAAETALEDTGSPDEETSDGEVEVSAETVTPSEDTEPSDEEISDGEVTVAAETVTPSEEPEASKLSAEDTREETETGTYTDTEEETDTDFETEPDTDIPEIEEPEADTDIPETTESQDMGLKTDEESEESYAPYGPSETYEDQNIAQTFEEVNRPVKNYDTSDIRAAFKDYDLDDLGEVEELEDVEQVEEVDDLISTNNLPLDDIEREFDAMAEQDYLSDAPNQKSRYDENGRMKHPSYMVLEETIKSKRDFDEEEMKLFGRYDGIEQVKAQLVNAIDDMSMVAAKGNVVVMGAEGTGRRGLAIDMVKAMQVMDSTFLGKVAKISGEALNKKNIPSTLRKLSNGALIVENAGGLTMESMEIIGESLITSQDTVLVVLEGTKETLQPILDSNKPLLEVVFDARIDINDFSDDDLVAYAKGYAKEQEYTIDEETGVLALYTKIAELQTLDHRVSIDEVKELVDKAIEHVNKKTFAHFLDVLFSRRYDDDDCIIIREKDFVE